MLQQDLQKNLRFHTCNDASESSFCLWDNGKDQFSRRLELPKVLGSPKYNKNLVKLSPLYTRKNLSDDDSPQLSLGLTKKGRTLDSHHDSQAHLRSITTLDSLNIGSSLNTSAQPSIDLESPSSQDFVSAEKLKLPLNHKKSSPVLSKIEIRKRENVSYRPSEILKAASLSEARLMMVGLNSMSTGVTEPSEQRSTKNIDLTHSTPKSSTKVGSLNHLPDLKKNYSAPGELEPFKCLLFNPIFDERILRQHIRGILKGLNYALNMLKPLPLSYVKSKQVMIREAQSSNQKTLILDLDETLVFACAPNQRADRIISLEDGEQQTIGIKIRPYAEEFLKKMKEHFEIIVYTASMNPYAEAVVKELDPHNKYISYVLDRSRCFQTKSGFFIKDLRILKNRDLKNMIIVDNLVHSFGFQIDNGVPILEWKGNSKDQELRYLMDYLINAKNCDDVREYNKEKLKLSELMHFPFSEKGII